MNGTVKPYNASERLSKVVQQAVERFGVNEAQLHIGHVILAALSGDPEYVHQIDAATDEKQTNLEVADLSSRLADAMNKSGLKTGDHVAIIAPNNIWLSLPFYACYYNGYATCTIDPQISQGELEVLFSNVRPKMVFCSMPSVDTVQKVLKANNLNSRIVTFQGENTLQAFIKEFNGNSKGFRPATFNQKETIAWLVLTSGTTGMPKAVVVPYDTLYKNILNWWKSSPAFKMERVFAVSSIQWLSSMLYFTLSSIISCTRIQTSAELTPKHVREAINKYKKTMEVKKRKYYTNEKLVSALEAIQHDIYQAPRQFGIPESSLRLYYWISWDNPQSLTFPPYLLRQFLLKEVDKCDLSSIKVVAIIGGMADEDIHLKLKEKINGMVLALYAMTETLMSPFAYVPDTPMGSVGLAQPSYSYKLVDDDGNEVNKPHEVGELWWKGGNFFKEYLNNPEETAKTLTPDGWIKTGDLMSRDENNFYYFHERKKLLIKYKSMQVSPMQIESVIKKHPQVEEAVVVGIPHPDYMEIAAAAIMTYDGETVEPREIFALVNSELPEYKRLHGGLYFVENFPLTAAGKINRPAVLKQAIEANRHTDQKRRLNSLIKWFNNL